MFLHETSALSVPRGKNYILVLAFPEAFLVHET